MTGKIYIASASATIIPNAHTYLVYDVDGDTDTFDNQYLISAGPASSTPGFWGQINILSDIAVQDSVHYKIDTDDDGIIDRDPEGYYNYTELDLNGISASTVWTLMASYAASIIDAPSVNYNPLGANSNSVTSSILSYAGIDFQLNTPKEAGTGDRYDPIHYQGNQYLLDGDGNGVLEGFTHDVDNIFIDGSGSDSFYGGEQSNSTRFDISDGFDEAQYTGDEDATVKIYNSKREVTGNDGDDFTDNLYSIEKVRFDIFDINNTLDYSNYNHAVEIDSFSLLKLSLDVSALTGIEVTEADGEVFEAVNFGTFKTTAYDDVVRMRGWGVTQPVTVDTGAGNDEIDISVEGSIIFAGSGNDVITGASSGTQISTGSGSDKIFLSNDNVLVTDASADDRIGFLGKNLTGGFKDLYSETPWANAWGGLVKFGKNTAGDLVIRDYRGNETFIANYASTLDGAAANTAGILIAQLSTSVHKLLEAPPEWNALGTLEAFGTANKAVTGESHVKGVDPLVLDLDGDGIELTARTSVSPYFDFDADGFSERAGWVGSDDGLLAVDANSDGKINDISELFGDNTQSGFAALSAYDSNTDGIISSADTNWADLKVWKDADRDGQTDAGELLSLDSLNIASIDLTPTTTTPEDVAGNTITAKGTFTYTDSSIGTIGDVDFALDNFDSKWLEDVTLTTQALALPEMKGQGTIANLRAAMTYLPSFGTLVDNAMSSLSTPDMGALRSAITPILNGWANVVAPVSGGPGTQTRIDVPLILNGDNNVVDFGIQRIDGQGEYWELAGGNDVVDEFDQVIARPTYADILAQDPGSGNSWEELDGDVISFMERWLDTQIPLGQDNLTGSSAIEGAKDMLEILWHEMDSIIVKIAAQDTRALGSFFDALEYNLNTNMFEPTTDEGIVPALEAIFTAAPGTVQGDIDHLTAWKPFLDVLIDDLDRGEDYLAATYSYLFQNLVAAYENVGLAASLTDAAAALDIPQNQIVTGSGTMNGTGEYELFYLDDTDQTAMGSDGRDAYIVGADFGTDVIDDEEDTLGNDDADIVRFAHHNASDLTASRQGLDFILTDNVNGDTLTIKNQFDFRRPALFGGYGDPARGVNEIVFADGEVWDRFDMSVAISDPQSGNQTIDGSGRTDYLDGGAGDDLLLGRDDADVYVFGQGYGHDTINEDPDNEKTILIDSPDVIDLKDLTLSDITFSRTGSSDNLDILVNGTSDQITIINQFNAAYTGTFGVQWFDRVEAVRDSQGAVILWDEIMEQMVADASTAGNDSIYGFTWEDTLDGGAGDDFLAGGYEGDSYYYGRGYGNDTIFDEQNVIANGDDIDRLFLASDILTTDIRVERNGNADDFVLRIIDTNETITLQDQNKRIGTLTPLWEVEEVVFNDSTVWTPTDLRTNYLASAGTSGDETITGFWTNDTIDGGAGNDILKGKSGGDTYLFGIGSGQDTVFDYLNNIVLNDPDAIQFTGGLISSDVTFSRSGDDLVISINGQLDTLTITDHFFGTLQSYRIENYIFANETLTHSDVYELIYGPGFIVGDENNNTLNGTPATDTIYGYGGNDNIDGKDSDDLIYGGTGNDDIDGGNGNDTIYGEDGVDTINGESGDDTIYGGAGNDDLKGSYGNDVFYGGAGDDDIEADSEDDIVYGEDGNDFILGDSGNDILHGGAGDDILRGGSGDDLFVYTEGIDEIDKDSLTNGGRGGTDTIFFDLDIDVYDLTFYHGSTDPDNAHIEIDANNRIWIDDHYGSSVYRLEYLTFRDGMELSFITDPANWSWGTTSADTINGTSGADIILANAGNDILEGLAGNDTIDGYDGDDSITGGTGDDKLYGGAGDDTFIFNLGDGQDVILDSDGTTDIIQFGAGISQSDITITDVGDYDIEITITGSPGDKITVLSQRDDTSTKQIEQLIFADSSVTYLTVTPPMIVNGDSGNNTLTADAGNDEIYAGAGNDIAYAGAGDDEVWGEDGSDSLFGEDGNDKILGGAGNDYIFGGEGADTLKGGTGADLYKYSMSSEPGSFDGDIIEDEGDSSVDQVQVLGMSSFETSVFGLDGDTLTITLGSLGTITITNQFTQSDSNRIEKLQQSLSGGGNNTLTFASMAFDFYGSNGNDILTLPSYGVSTSKIHEIFGEDGSDTITGGGYIDYLYGGTGNDTVIGGDHNDTLWGDDGDDTLMGEDGADLLLGGTGSNLLCGGTGADLYQYDAQISGTFDGDTIEEDGDASTATIDEIRVNGLSSIIAPVFQISGDDMIVNLDGVGSLTIVNQFAQGNEDRVERIRENLLSGGGTALNIQNMALEFEGTAGNDTIALPEYGVSTHTHKLYGLAGNDTLTGNDGNNYLYGGDNDDVLRGGDGTDILWGDDGDDILYSDTGVDTLLGGLGADTFVFEDATAYDGTYDRINDFDAAEGDAIDISDLLSSYDPLQDAIEDFVKITGSSNKNLYVDSDGGGDSFTRIAYLQGASGVTTDEEDMVTNGVLVVA